MKKFFLFVCSSIMVITTTFGHLNSHYFASLRKIKPPETYNFFLMGDGCFHLYRLTGTVVINNDGMAVTAYQWVRMDSSNYIGTTEICPSGSNYYC